MVCHYLSQTELRAWLERTQTARQATEARLTSLADLEASFESLLQNAPSALEALEGQPPEAHAPRFFGWSESLARTLGIFAAFFSRPLRRRAGPPNHDPLTAEPPLRVLSAPGTDDNEQQYPRMSGGAPAERFYSPPQLTEVVQGFARGFGPMRLFPISPPPKR